MSSIPYYNQKIMLLSLFCLSRQRALEDEVDPPVQGPINREPDEKLFPGKIQESGIKKM